MLQVFRQVSDHSLTPVVFTSGRSWSSPRDLCSFPSLPGSAQLPTPPTHSPTHPPTREGPSLNLREIPDCPTAPDPGFPGARAADGQHPQLGVGSRVLIGTLPGPVARGPLGARQYPRSSLWWVPARAGYQPLYSVGHCAASLLDQPPQPCFSLPGTLPPNPGRGLSRVGACSSHTGR